MQGLASQRSHCGEQGMALAMVLVIMVIGLVLAVGISVVAMNTLGRSKDAADTASALGPAEEAIEAYRQALSSGTIGEQTNFMFTQAALLKYVNKSTVGCASTDTLCLYANSDATFKGYKYVDSNIPTTNPTSTSDYQLTVRRKSGTNSTYRFWQIVAVVQPRYGVVEASNSLISPGGRVVIYVRGWVGDATGNDGSTARTSVMRADLRAPRFSDYQILADGKIRLGNGATINGKIHSNGFDQSFLDQFRSEPAQIATRAGATCTSTARFSTRSGSVDVTASPTCQDPAFDFSNKGDQVNLLRVNEATDTIRTQLCASNAASPNLRVACFTKSSAAVATEPSTGLEHFSLRLNADDTVTVDGVTAAISTLNTATVHQPRSSTANYGAVLVFDGSVRVSGKLGSNSRLTIIAHTWANNATQTASIWMYGLGGYDTEVGASNDPTSSLGMIADGDIYAQESTACPLTVRAALVATSGMLSMDPVFRNGAIGDRQCTNPAGFQLVGSSAGHLPPFMIQSEVNAGYANRSYQWDPKLYDNPPPLFATTGPWTTVASMPANMDCLQTHTNTAAAAAVNGVLNSSSCR